MSSSVLLAVIGGLVALAVYRRIQQKKAQQAAAGPEAAREGPEPSLGDAFPDDVVPPDVPKGRRGRRKRAPGPVVWPLALPPHMVLGAEVLDGAEAQAAAAPILPVRPGYVRRAQHLPSGQVVEETSPVVTRRPTVIRSSPAAPETAEPAPEAAEAPSEDGARRRWGKRGR